MKKNREFLGNISRVVFPNTVKANGTLSVIYKENLLLKKKIKSLSREIEQLKITVDNLKNK